MRSVTIYSGQHTFVATLRGGSQKAGEGWLRLPFKPLYRPLADQADRLPCVLGRWSARLLGHGHPTMGGAACG